MPDKEPQFVVNDRRKFNLEGDLREEAGTPPVAAAPQPPAPKPAPQATKPGPVAATTQRGEEKEPDLPAGPTAEEAAKQMSAFRSSSERIDEMVRAQNPGAPREPQVSFLHVVQSFYMTALMQLGVGTPQGEQMRVDILGARQSIDMLDVIAQKTAGNLTEEEKQMLDSALFELRMLFTRLATAISNEATVKAAATANRATGNGPKIVR